MGALAAPPTGRRLSLQSVTEAVCVGGREMSRLHLSLMSRPAAPMAASGEVEREGEEEEMVVLGTTSMLLPSSSSSAAAATATVPGERRCHSVTVSVEGALEAQGAAAGAGAGAVEGEEAVNVEIEQAEGFKVRKRDGWMRVVGVGWGGVLLALLSQFVSIFDRSHTLQTKTTSQPIQQLTEEQAAGVPL